jgi:tRNA(Leu) C34 or U34 (ribose-2'-O)-methylase TrmL
MNNRGFAAIGLFQPKTPINVGGVLRAAWCYDAAFVAVQGTRFKRAATDVYNTFKHIPLLRVDDLSEVVPFDCVPVAIEKVKDASSLNEYVHPERAFYMFGPEDGNLKKELIDQCRDIVQIPMSHENACMNLAATVNVVLYDRMAKRYVHR